jgi:prepilin-type N-terminal cleavage/methylation domain-containing protein
MRRRAGQDGFTLIELILVLATVAVVAAMAAPRYAGALANYRSRCAAQRVATDLAAAAAEALAQSSARTVRFDRAAAAYTVNGGAPVRLDQEPYRAALVSVDLGGDEAITFDGYGAPDSGGTIVVRSGSFTRSVRVDPLTGRGFVE